MEPLPTLEAHQIPITHDIHALWPACHTVTPTVSLNRGKHRAQVLSLARGLGNSIIPKLAKLYFNDLRGNKTNIY